MFLTKRKNRHRRHNRVRAKVFGTARKPRLCVFRSIKGIYSQLIDDEKGKTIIAVNGKEINVLFDESKKKVSERNFKEKKANPVRDSRNKREAGKGQAFNMTKIDRAWEVGKLIAKKAIEKKIKEVVFDRGGYKYHGRVKAIAEGAREGGLLF